MKPIQSGPWPIGINNKQQAHAMPTDDNGNHVALRNAVNADVDRIGYASRRSGYALELGLTGAHSGWSGPINGAFVVEAFKLYKLSASLTKTLLVEGITGRMSYCEVGDTVFMSDGARNWKYSAGVLSTWGVSGTIEDGTITSLPPGRIVSYHNGRMYIVAGQFVFYSEPFAFDWYRPATNFIAFPADVTVFEPCASGIWTVSDKTRFYAGGGPEDFVPRIVADYGATFGTSSRINGKDIALWFSDNGPVMGSGDGAFKELADANVAIGSAESGTSLVRQFDGKDQFIISLTAPAAPTMAATAWFEAETIRKGA